MDARGVITTLLYFILVLLAIAVTYNGDVQYTVGLMMLSLVSVGLITLHESSKERKQKRGNYPKQK